MLKYIILLFIIFQFNIIKPMNEGIIDKDNIELSQFILREVNEKYTNSNAPNIIWELNLALRNIDKEHWSIVLAICYIESRFYPCRISHTNDYGIMQVNKYWHSNKYDFNRMSDIQYGIESGYEIFLACLNRANNDKMKALNLYNGSSSYSNLFLQLI